MAELVLRRFEDILQDAGIYFQAQSGRATDWNPGSVLRTLYELYAVEAERVYVGLYAGLNAAIDNAVYDAWGFVRRPAVAATGQVQLTKPVGADFDITIYEGQQFLVPGSGTQVYRAAALTTIVASQALGYVPIVAVNPGTQGNVGAQLITQAAPDISGIALVTNPSPLTNGLDVATDAERRTDFAAYIRALPRGTPEAVALGALTAGLADDSGTLVEAVRKANLVEGAYTRVSGSNGQNLIAGQVAVYVHNGVGATSAQLVAACNQVLNGYADAQGVWQAGWRPTGIQVIAYAASEQIVSCACTLTLLDDGYLVAQVLPQVISAMRAVYDALDVGDTLRIKTLHAAIKDVPGVLDFNVNLVANTVATDRNYLIVPGPNSPSATASL